ncbi:acyl-CoA carboxylase epsilon subunit [Streptomyces sp. NPDC048491]|uniref:acyl-CoA carboxylase epsilon subunit n=1 Tax=Streptomyces sp. NPDC048491 TaxID=3157207 RepID=UPI003439E351
MPPDLCIHHGRPDADDIAALSVVLTALTGAAATQHGSRNSSTPKANWDRPRNSHMPANSWRATP